MKTFCVQTLGCKVNQYESQHVKEALEQNGWADAFTTGDEFAAFIKEQDERVATTLEELGLI